MNPDLNPTVRWYNQLAFHFNYIVANTTEDLSLDEVRAAARNHCLLQLLDKRFHFADFYSFVHRPEILRHLEAGLSDAASWLYWQERRRLGPSPSGLALAMAIVLEAIQNANCNPQSNPSLLATPWEKDTTSSLAIGDWPFRGNKFARCSRQILQRISTYFKAFQRISNQKLPSC